MGVEAPVDELQVALGGDQLRERCGVALRGAPQSRTDSEPAEPHQRPVGVALHPVAAPSAVAYVLVAVQADVCPARSIRSMIAGARSTSGNHHDEHKDVTRSQHADIISRARSGGQDRYPTNSARQHRRELRRRRPGLPRSRECRNAGKAQVDAARPATRPAQFESKARNTPFGGWSCRGVPWMTVVDGRVVMKQRRVIDDWTPHALQTAVIR